MALPILYWMLECGRCSSRRVVRDTYLEWVGTDDPIPAAGSGYGGRPLPDRYGCLKGCTGPPRVIGSIFSLDDDTMWLHDPHRPRQMNEQQREEWARLIREARLHRLVRTVTIATVFGIALIAVVVFMIRGCGA